MNDQQGLDQQAIDDLLAAASKELPGLTPTAEIITEPQAPAIPEESLPPSPEIPVLEEKLSLKNNLLFLLKSVKQKTTKKHIIGILTLFILVMASSGFLGYKMSQHTMENQDPLQKIIGQGITFEEKNFVSYAGLGNEPIVNAFLDAGMSVNSLRPTDGWSPLIAASFYKKPEIVKLLLEKEASVNLQDKYGKTALMQAVSMGAEDIVTMLLEAGSNPNLQDKNGRTALMEAYSKKQAKIAEMLKTAGADPTIKPAKTSVNPLIPAVMPKSLPTSDLPPSIGTETTLTLGKAGFVQIGMPLAEIQKKYPSVTTNQKYINGNKKTIATVYLNGPNNPSLELELSDSNLKLVSTISTYDDKFLTEKQISIKSTVADIRTQYPVTELRIIDNALYVAVKSMKMLFELDIPNEGILGEWLTTGNATALPGDVKVKRIIIY